MRFIFGQSKHHDAKSSGMTSELTDLISERHYVEHVSDDKQLSEILESMSLPETRTFVVLPEADQFEQQGVDYREKRVLERILEEGHRTGVHVIGWWELQNSPKLVHKNYQTLPVRKVLLNVTKSEVDGMKNQDWGWRAGRAFFWDTPNLDGGNWFVPFEPPEPSMLTEALNDLKATNG
jgi:hypothetical protein